MKYRRERAVFAAAFVLLLIVEAAIALFVSDRFVRPYLGDVLVVILLFCLIRVFFPRGLRLLPFYLFLLAAGIEVLQYFGFLSWFGLEENAAAKLVFGSVFSFADLLCYLIGCLVCALVDYFRPTKKE